MHCGVERIRAAGEAIRRNARRRWQRKHMVASKEEDANIYGSLSIFPTIIQLSFRDRLAFLADGHCSWNKVGRADGSLGAWHGVCGDDASPWLSHECEPT